MTSLTRSLNSVTLLCSNSVYASPHIRRPASVLCGLRSIDLAGSGFFSAFSSKLSTSGSRSFGFLKADMHTMPAKQESLATDIAAESFVYVDREREGYKDLSDSVVVIDQDRNNNGSGSSCSKGYVCGEMASGEAEGESKMILPPDLLKKAMVLRCESAEGGSCDVYLVGTAHVSQESCREVQSVISYLKPQIVFLELCSSRIAVLSPQNFKVPTIGEMIDMWKKKHNLFGILYSWFLAKVATQLNVFPGSEFRVAFDEAIKCGAKVILGDRPVQITLRRTWEKMSFRHKAALVYSLLFQAVFLPSAKDLDRMLKEMDDVDALTLLIQEMSKAFPSLMETLVHERDMFMSSKLLGVARQHTSVVAVVGKGHLQGIKKHWKQPVELKDLLEIPSRKGHSSLKVISSVGVVLGAAVISGIYFARKK